MKGRNHVLLPLRRFHRWRRADARRPLADLSDVPQPDPPGLDNAGQAEAQAWSEAVPAFAHARTDQAAGHAETTLAIAK